MNSLPHIIADFNDLGYEVPNVIPLGAGDSPNLQGQVLCDGMEAIFFEPGEMEAHGTLRRKVMLDGAIEWEAVIDIATLRHYYTIDANGVITPTVDSNR